MPSPADRSPSADVGILDRLSQDERRALVRLVAISSLGSALIASVVPIVAWSVFQAAPSWSEYAVLGGYAVALVGSYWIRRRYAPALSDLFEQAMTSLRTEIFDRIRSSDLRTIESIDSIQVGVDGGVSRGGASSAVTRDIENLSRITMTFIDGLRLGVVLVFRSLYVVLISGVGFLIWCAVLYALVRCLTPEVRRSRQARAQLAATSDRFDTGIAQLLDGFTQLKMDERAGAMLVAELSTANHNLADDQYQFEQAGHRIHVTSYTILMVGIGAMLFSTSVHLLADVASLSEVLTLMFFIIPPLLFLIDELQEIVTTQQSWRNLAALMTRLGMPDGRSPTSLHTAPAAFQELCFDQVGFHYRDDPDRFAVGPITLTVRPGQLTLIKGGNGSGKTTLLKLLAGLYQPSEGRILLDGLPLSASPDPHARHRGLVSAIFTDHHLFERAYGLDISDPSQINMLLERMELNHKSELRARSFHQPQPVHRPR